MEEIEKLFVSAARFDRKELTIITFDKVNTYGGYFCIGNKFSSQAWHYLMDKPDVRIEKMEKEDTDIMDKVPNTTIPLVMLRYKGEEDDK